jgi:hypothetical protein
VSDDENVLEGGVLVKELVELGQGGLGCEGFGEQDPGLVAGLCANEGGGLEAALEGAGEDDVELDAEGVEDVGQVQAMVLAVLIEGALEVQDWIGAADAGTGVAKDIQIHRTVTIINQGCF